MDYKPVIFCQSCGIELKNLYEGAQHIMNECIVETKRREIIW